MECSQLIDVARSCGRRGACRRLLLSVALTLLVGCGPSTVTAKGRVTLDGEPLNEALIVFVPLQAGSKKTGAAVNGGAYELVGEAGLLPGKYRVEIVDNPPLELVHQAAAEANLRLGSRRVIPAQYSQNSPLAVEIGGATSPDLQRLDFTLESRPSNAR